MSGSDRRLAIIFGGTVLLVSIICATAAAISIDDGARASTMISLILGPVTSLIGIGVLAVRLNGVGSTLDKVSRDTTDLTNGLLDAKIRAAAADVLHPDLIDPTALGQIDKDRARRDAKDAVIEAEQPGEHRA